MPEVVQPRRQESGPSLFRQILQGAAIFIIVQTLVKQFLTGGKSSTQPNASQAVIPEFADRPSIQELEGEYSPIPQRIAPIWPQDSILDILVYVSPSSAIAAPVSRLSSSLVLKETGFKLSDYKDTRDISTTLQVPKEVQNNGSLWAHIYVAQSDSPWDPAQTNYDPAKAFFFTRPLTRYLVKKKVAKTRNLLSGNNEAEEVPEAEPETSARTVASYYHPNITVSLVPDTGTQAFTTMHPAVREWIQLESTGARDITGQNGWYYPIVFLNTFWQLQSHMTELNSTVTELPLNIHLNSLANWKFSIISGLDLSAKQNQDKLAQGETLPGGGDGSELEEVKRIFLDSNVYLLGTTIVVSILHTIFELLAFKSDVSHWRNKKDNVGVSMRTILANVVMQGIIFLYLLDNTENTSWMILIGQGMGIVIEAWKITKTVNVRVRPRPETMTSFPLRYLPYIIVFEDKHQLSETELKTQEYDEEAFKYLYWVGVPLLLAYAAYSLVYESHKSWYSFIIATLVGSVYAYGFLMMVPSLYINYRLKSVAHMPAKAMTYKFLNTFIDDLFAFTIKMPTLHRLATLRDDVIFFIYLYQSYKYKVDYTRVNEFGQGGQEEEVTEKVANKPLQAPAEGTTKEVVKPEAVQATGVSTGGAKRRK